MKICLQIFEEKYLLKGSIISFCFKYRKFYQNLVIIWFSKSFSRQCWYNLSHIWVCVYIYIFNKLQLCPSTRMDLPLNNPRRLICHLTTELNKKDETKFNNCVFCKSPHIHMPIFTYLILSNLYQVLSWWISHIRSNWKVKGNDQWNDVKNPERYFIN